MMYPRPRDQVGRWLVPAVREGMLFPCVNIQALPGSSPGVVGNLIVSHPHQVSRSVEITSHHRVQKGSVRTSLQTLHHLRMSSAFQMVMLIEQNGALSREFCFLSPLPLHALNENPHHRKAPCVKQTCYFHIRTWPLGGWERL